MSKAVGVRACFHQPLLAVSYPEKSLLRQDPSRVFVRVQIQYN